MAGTGCCPDCREVDRQTSYGFRFEQNRPASFLCSSGMAAPTVDLSSWEYLTHILNPKNC